MFTLQSFKDDTLAADITDSATSATLSTGAFGTPTGEQMLVIDYDVAAKREIVKCAIDGTAVTSIDRAQDGTAAVAHSSGAKVIMAFVPSHYKALTDFVGAKAYLDTAITTTVSGAAAKVALDAESYDVGSDFAGGTYTAPVTGYYFVSGSVYFTNITAAGKYFQAMIYVNGSAAKTSTLYSATGVVGLSPNPTDVVYVEAGQTIELYYTHNDATTVDIFNGVSNTCLTVVLLKEV